LDVQFTPGLGGGAMEGTPPFHKCAKGWATRHKAVNRE
jgi:hypothetical protein